ncbi:late competence development ComFB family protein [Moorena producens JHB]|uniref:Late competence development ComFB family protein n=1 Tax=Moorena producens (strain JHB) TaxID=1454205 RepID=A0A1D9FX35_MOOP1|nr:late competence development ComFB family protein [Moorena producens]AOY79926.1 late competence development ComFB family protein [Moorena producens JHB]
MEAHQSHQAITYQNVMEILVAQEVERQKSRLSPKLAKYINHVEVATYALNRLPPLYASSEEGRRQQQLKGHKKLRQQITTTVRQAFAAVQRDPIRLCTPIRPEEDTESLAAKLALQGLRELLKNQNITWYNLVSIVKQTLIRATQVRKNRQKEQPRDPIYGWNDSRYQL